MDLKFVKCPDMDEIKEDYRKRSHLNDALVCGKTILPPQKVWKFKETKNIRGIKTLTAHGGADKVPIPWVQGMKPYIGKYLVLHLIRLHLTQLNYFSTILPSLIC
jgi:hypothetical protein